MILFVFLMASLLYGLYAFFLIGMKKLRGEDYYYLTPEQLDEEAKSTKKLLIGCKGLIYDVSVNAEMYGPGTTYNCFVGKDSSVALAKLKFDAEYFDPDQYDWRKDLNSREMGVLHEWNVKFGSKYPVYGEMVYENIKRH
uniref:Cytochrome b5 heme-binding domain-containing protein n=1 Tax=Strombidium rassoulzadegani TaxID=1082188 RepID=A0A7S3CI58_9SPIT|mmetsp:Transcript_11374/g.19175  ORF Transcript_11374/g.19175 Transcript_11374/m.19175 type:complete len:140 (+) Transcript_11374:11-430(+)